MVKHDFYLLSIGHYDVEMNRYILPLKCYSSLSSAKRAAEKKRNNLRIWEIDWFCIHKLNFDDGDIFTDRWYRDNGGEWNHVKN